MSIKARFQQQQPPVDIRQINGIAYVFICLNETQRTETYLDMGEGEIQETCYEYDYNEIIGPEEKLPIEEIQLNPENYLDYKYSEVKQDSGAQALAKVQELKEAIERGLTL